MRLVVLRDEEPPEEAVVVRGGRNGLADETIRRTATESFNESGFYGVSVFVALPDDLPRMCREMEHLRRYPVIQECPVGRLRSAGFALLATEADPHFDVVLPDLDGATLERLRGAFGPLRPNPGRS